MPGGPLRVCCSLNIDLPGMPFGMAIPIINFLSGKIAETPNECSDFKNSMIFGGIFTDHMASS